MEREVGCCGLLLVVVRTETLSSGMVVWGIQSRSSNTVVQD